MASSYNFKLNFNVNRDGLDKAKQEINNLKKEIESNPAKFNIDTNDIKDALRQVDIYQKALEKAFNQDLGKLNTTEFLRELKKAESSLSGLKDKFSKLGIDASNSFGHIERDIEKTGLSIKKTGKLVESLGHTINNTIKWNLASQGLDIFTGGIGKAIGFTKALDNSLNNIRIVTGKSNEEMEVFAKNANEAAKALGRTTTEYTDASLLYFQQGKTASEVRDLTKATLIASNVTGESTADAAELLTAALNGYGKQASYAMEMTDKFAAVGAASGSDFNELAIGFSKVASMANTAGVEIDQLNGMLATVSTVTREAPESIGTSFKTIFGRMTDLKAGKKDEEGWALGDVQGALQKAGFSMLDENGRLKETGKLLTEIGDKWKNLNKESQLALSVAMAGNRQQNRLISLFSNWEMYQKQLTESQNAQGAATEQNLIRMDSIEAKAKKLKASLEELWDKLLDSDVAKGFLDFLTSIVGYANDFVDAIGGVGPLLLMIGGLLTRTLFSSKMSNGIVGALDKYKQWQEFRKNDKAIMEDPQNSEHAKRNKEEYLVRQHLTKEEHEAYKLARQSLEEEEKKLKILKEEVKLKEDAAKAAAEKVTGAKDKITENDNALNKKIEEQKAKDDKVAQARKNLDVLKEAKDAKKGKITVDNISKDLEADFLAAGYKKEQLEYVLKEKDVIAQVTAHRQESINKLNKETLGIIKNKELAEEAAKVQQEELNTIKKEGDELRKNLSTEEKLLAKEEARLAAAKKKIETQKNDMTDDTSSKDAMSTLGKKADNVKKVETVLNGLTTAAVVIPSIIGALEQLGEAGDDFVKKGDALASVLNTVGMALMMSGNPYAIAAGAVASLVAVVGDLILHNTGLAKTLKDNEELLKKTALAADEAKTKIKALATVEADYRQLQSKMKYGSISIDDLNTEDLEAYYNLSNKIAESAPDLVAYYDEQGRAVLDLTKNIKDLTETQEALARQANQTRVDNRDNFAEQYSTELTKAQETIGEKKRILEVISKGKDTLDMYNYVNNTNYSQEDVAKLNAEVQEQQAKLKETSENINQNIVNALFNSSEAFSKLNDKQKQMARSLFDVDRATELAYDKKRLESYEKGVLRVMEVISGQGKLQEEIKDNIEEINKLSAQDPNGNASRIQELQAENKELEEQAGHAEKIAASFEKLDKFKQRFVTSGLSYMNLEGADQDKALSKLTDYYTNNDPIKSGPMSMDKLKDITGFGETNELEFQSKDQIKEELKERESGINHSRKQNLYAWQDGFKPGAGKEESDELTKQANVLQQLTRERDAYIEGQERASIAAIAEKDANAQLEEAYWSEIGAMAKTVEGFNQVADAYNENLEYIGTLNSVLGENVDVSSMTKDQMDQVASSLEGVADEVPGLAEALARYNQEGASAFGDLAKYAQEAQSEIARNNGRMYALMHQDDVKYYQQFLEKNKEQTRQVFIEYGVRASNYANYGEYERALHVAMEKGKVNVTQQAINRMILDNEELVNTNADGINQQTKDTQAGATQNVTIWSVMTNESLSIFDKLGYGFRAICDFMYNIAVDAANAIVGVLNGIASGFGAVVNGIIDKANSVIDISPEVSERFGLKKKEHVDWGNIEYYDRANWAGEYLADVASKYSAGVDDLNFNYVDPAKGIDHKTLEDLGIDDGSGKQTSGDEGPLANPDAGSSSGAKPKDDMNEKLDPLHDTNNLLEIQDNLLKSLQRSEKDLYGAAKVDNLNKQNKALEAKTAILKQQLAVLDEQSKVTAAKLAGEGVTFDANGLITNYNAIIKAKQDAANAITDADGKDDAQDKVKLFIDDMKNYEEWTIKTKFDKQQAIEELKELQKQIHLEKLEAIIEVKLDMGEEKAKLEKFLIDMNSDFTNSAEEYKTTVESIATQLDNVKTIEKHISEIKADSSLSDKEKVELLKQYEDKLIDATSAAKDFQEQLKKLSEDGVKEGLELLNQQIDKYENVGKSLDHIMTTMRLIGEGQNFEDLDDIYNIQQETISNQLASLNDIFPALKKYRDSLEEGSEEWESANEQVMKLSESIDKLVEDSLKSYQEQLKTATQGILKTLDAELFNGSSYDEVSKALDKLQEQQDEYLSTQEKIVWLGNMQAEIQENIDASTDENTKKKLQEFLDSELGSMKEKDTLSQNEVDRAEKLYKITLAQIALDEARNNKTIQRLVRDSSGNWSYQYVEDTKAVSDAQEELSKSLKDLMDYDSETLKENEAKQLEAKKELQDELQDILEKGLNGEYETQQDFYDAMEKAQTDFNSRIEQLNTEHHTLISNVSSSSLSAVLNAYSSNKDALGLYSSDTETIMKQLSEKMGTDWTKVSELVKVLNSDNTSSFEAFCESVGISWDETGSALIDGFTGVAGKYQTDFSQPIGITASELQANLSSIYDNISEDWKSAVSLQITNNDKIDISTKNAVDNIVSKWDEYKKKVAEVIQQNQQEIYDYNNSIDTDEDSPVEILKRKTEELISTNTDLASNFKTVSKKIKNEWDDLAAAVKKYASKQENSFDSLISKAQKYITKLNETIAKMQEAAQTSPVNSSEEESVSEGTSGSSSSSSGGSGSYSGSKASSPTIGGTVHFKTGYSQWSQDSWGGGNAQVDPISAQKEYTIAAQNNGMYLLRGPDGGEPGWVTKDQLVGFDTGGYTGEFGSDGKVALLHEKEIVLNQMDTANILSAVQIVRDYATMIKGAMGNSASLIAGASNANQFQQTVQINADFSGVKSSGEIEQAFINLANRAAQFAQKK